MRKGKIFLKVFLLVLLITIPFQFVSAEENSKIKLSLEALKSSVLSGQDGTFKISFKLTGIETKYTNGILKFHIPEHYEIASDPKSLAIDNVIPSLSADKTDLVYNFNTIASGLDYEFIFRIKTPNGTIINGSEANIIAEFTSEELNIPIKSQAKITINSSLNISNTLSVLSISDSSGALKNTPPTADDIVNWQTKILVPKKQIGMEFIKEGTLLTVVNTLPEGLTYISDDSGGIYDASSKTVTWTFPAPTIEQQKAMTESIISRAISMKTRVDTASNFKQYSISTQSSINTLSKIVESNIAQASIITGKSTPTSNGPGKQLWVPATQGPINGKGDIMGNSNTDPLVYDTDILGFGMTIFEPYNANSPDKDFISATSTMNIDKQLRLFEIKTPSIFHYRPDDSYPSNVTLDPSKYPKYDIVATIGNESRTIIPNAEPNTIYTLSDMGISPDTYVNKIELRFNYVAAGTLTRSADPLKILFTIKKGYSGSIKNTHLFNVTGYNFNGLETTYTLPSNPEAISGLSGARTAQVVPRPKENVPNVTTSVSFSNNLNGIVYGGPNRIVGSFTNTSISGSNLRGPFSNVVLLPKGVSFNEENPNLSGSGVSIYKVIHNWKGTGQQLVILQWTQANLEPNSLLDYEFDVNINENIGQSSLDLYTYGYADDSELTVPNKTDSITDSIIENNNDRLNPLVDESNLRVRSGNTYTLVKNIGMNVLKTVKGNLDQNFSDFGLASPGGTILYSLSLTQRNPDQDLKNFTFLDILPTPGDLGITDIINRGSVYTIYLTGPVLLPEEWTDHATVYYSTEKNPSRIDLTKNTIYPIGSSGLSDPAGAQIAEWKTKDQITDWKMIRSIKIEQNSNDILKDVTSLSLEIPLRAPDLNELKSSNELSALSENLTDPKIDLEKRASWNSFAYQENYSEVIEPLKVGVGLLGYTGDIYLLKYESGTISKQDGQQNPSLDENYHLRSGKPLEGAIFNLIDDENNLLDSSTTDSYGQIHFSNVRYGNYKLVEIKSAQGYELLKEPIDIKVSEENNSESIIYIPNNPQTVLPETGGSGLKILIIFSFIFIGIGCIILLSYLLLLYKKGRKSYEN